MPIPEAPTTNPYDRLPQAPIPPELFDRQEFTGLQAQLDKLIPDVPYARPAEGDALKAARLLEERENTLMTAIDQEGYLLPTLGMIKRMQSIHYNSGMSNDSVRHLRSTAAGLVGRHIRRISSVLDRRPDSESLRASMDVVIGSLNDAYDMATPDQVDFLINHVEEAARRSLFSVQNKGAYGNVSRTRVESEVLRYATQDQQRDYAATISKMITDPEPEVATVGIDFLAGLSSAPLFDVEVKNEVQETAVRGLVEGYGLDFDTVKNDWGIASGVFSAMYEGANLKALHSLESKHSGICKTLYEEFGIVNFARYPESMLIAQYEQREDTKIPYGLLVTAASDGAGVMWFNNAPFGDFQKQLAGLDTAVRIYEVDHKLGIPRAFIKAGRNYGPMQFRVIVGHGRPDHMGFGESPEPYGEDTPITPETETGGAILTKYDIQRMNMPGLDTKYAVPGCETILVSCSTGAEDGLAQEMSAVHPDAPVTAPNVPVSLKKLIATKGKNGQIHIDVTYGFRSTSGAKQRFLGGVVVDSVADTTR